MFDMVSGSPTRALGPLMAWDSGVIAKVGFFESNANFIVLSPTAGDDTTRRNTFNVSI